MLAGEPAHDRSPQIDSCLLDSQTSQTRGEQVKELTGQCVGLRRRLEPADRALEQQLIPGVVADAELEEPPRPDHASTPRTNRERGRAATPQSQSQPE